MLVYLLWLVLWFVIAWGLPPFVENIRSPHSDKMPKGWAIAVALLIVGGMDYLYKTVTPLATSVERLEELVGLVNNGQDRDALQLLRETASDPPWEPRESMDEPAPPSPF